MIRYVRDAICGTIFEKLKPITSGLANGATEMTLTLLDYHNDVNETSVQALGWIGKEGNGNTC